MPRVKRGGVGPQHQRRAKETTYDSIICISLLQQLMGRRIIQLQVVRRWRLPASGVSQIGRLFKPPSSISPSCRTGPTTATKGARKKRRRAGRGRGIRMSVFSRQGWPVSSISTCSKLQSVWKVQPLATSPWRVEAALLLYGDFTWRCLGRSLDTMEGCYGHG